MPAARPSSWPGRSPFKLPPRDPLLYFVERLRDEAHRFAIGSHRTRRKKDIREAGLQEISGIGPTRKRALLRHFGTVKAIERASLPDLAQVPGINAETARKIYEFFHEQARDRPRRRRFGGNGNDHQAAGRRHPGGGGRLQEHGRPARARNRHLAGQASACFRARRASDRGRIPERGADHRQARADDQRHPQ